jgi:hypothetical protein
LDIKTFGHSELTIIDFKAALPLSAVARRRLTGSGNACYSPWALIAFWFEFPIFNVSMNQQKISIRFFNDREVRAVWDEENSKWWFSVLDIVSVLTDQDDYIKTRNYWKYLKTKFKKENNELVSLTNQLKLQAADGKDRFRIFG